MFDKLKDLCYQSFNFNIFGRFFKKETDSSTSVSNRRLATVFPSKAKEKCLSVVDHNLVVINVSHCFGHYIKFYEELVNSNSA